MLQNKPYELDIHKWAQIKGLQHNYAVEKTERKNDENTYKDTRSLFIHHMNYGAGDNYLWCFDETYCLHLHLLHLSYSQQVVYMIV